MQIIPSIDLLDGKCVRLVKGDYGKSKTYSDDPVQIALEFEAAGAAWIHVVDLDAARGGQNNNRQWIRKICRSVSCSVEVGGGVRSSGDVDDLLEAGVRRLVLGTILVNNPDLVAEWTAHYGDLFFAGVDASEGIVKTSGWTGDSGVRDLDLAGKLAELGLSGVIYTSIARDGMLSGPDIERTNSIAEASGLPVIISGGVSGPEDVLEVDRKRLPGVIGVIIGKAIYEKRLSVADLIARFHDTRDEIPSTGTD